MNGFALNTIQECYFGSTPVSALYYGSTKIWPSTPPAHDYSQDYFTTEAGENNMRFYYAGSGTLGTEYSTDDGATWQSGNGSDITTGWLQQGDKVLWRCSTPRQSTYVQDGLDNGGQNTILTEKQGQSGQAEFKVYGNMMSLLYGSNFTNQLSMANYSFYQFFREQLVTDAENLILPATTLSIGCYYEMFDGCFLLENAPALPATVLVNECYYNMFRACSALKYIKCLATTNNSYNGNATHDWVQNANTTQQCGRFVWADTGSQLWTWPTSGDDDIPYYFTMETQAQHEATKYQVTINDNNSYGLYPVIDSNGYAAGSYVQINLGAWLKDVIDGSSGYNLSVSATPSSIENDLQVLPVMNDDMMNPVEIGDSFIFFIMPAQDVTIDIDIAPSYYDLDTEIDDTLVNEGYANTPAYAFDEIENDGDTSDFWDNRSGNGVHALLENINNGTYTLTGYCSQGDFEGQVSGDSIMIVDINDSSVTFGEVALAFDGVTWAVDSTSFLAGYYEYWLN